MMAYPSHTSEEGGWANLQPASVLLVVDTVAAVPSGEQALCSDESRFFKPQIGT
jgi:hypothetical protein